MYSPTNTSTLIFGWKWKLNRRTFIDVVSTVTKQRWNNVDRITSIQRRWINVVSTLKYGWKWKLSRRMFIDVVSTLTKQCWNNIDRVTLIQCWRPIVVSTLIELRRFNADESTLFQRWNMVENESWADVCLST